MSDAIGTIETIVQDWIAQGRAFTAYEVSREARSRGIQERHANLRNHVHGCSVLQDAVNFGSYQRDNVPVGSGLSAILFHPDNYDISQYQPLDRNDGTTATVTKTAPVAVQPVAQPASPTVSVFDVDEFELDFRNRLLIRKGFVTSINANPGDLVGVFVENNMAVIRKHDPLSGGLPTAQMRVERDGEVRVSKTSLEAAGLTGDKFSVEVNGSQIEIS